MSSGYPIDFLITTKEVLATFIQNSLPNFVAMKKQPDEQGLDQCAG